MPPVNSEFTPELHPQHGAKVFAPGELASPERRFENQKGCEEKSPLPAGFVPPGRYLGGVVDAPETSLRPDEPGGGGRKN